jgi:molybdopterin synthase catalytic subunit
MTAKTADLVDKIEAAQAATQMGLVHEYLDQADAVLDRAVGAHRAGRLSDRDAAVVIAVISELRIAANKANRVVLQGVEAGETLTRTD